MFASRNGHIHIVKYLIEAKVSLNLEKDIDFAISFDDSYRLYITKFSVAET